LFAPSFPIVAVTGTLLTITRSRPLPVPLLLRRSFPLPSFFEPFRESSPRERPLLPALSLLEAEFPESLPRLLLSLLELLLELLLEPLLGLLLELGSDRGDSAGALGVSLLGLSLGGVRPSSCALDTVAAPPPMSSTNAEVITPFLILSRLNFIVVSLL
jgi:hypothetical protein